MDKRIDILYGEVLDIYSLWDDGKISDKKAIKQLTEVCKEFLKKK